MAFNPIIKFIQNQPLSGFYFHLLPTTTTTNDLPKETSFVYILWDESQSDEPVGWYLARVTDISEDAVALVRYKKGSLIESVNL